MSTLPATAPTLPLEAQPVRLESTWLRATLGAMVLLTMALSGLLLAASFSTSPLRDPDVSVDGAVATTTTSLGATALPVSATR